MASRPAGKGRVNRITVHTGAVKQALRILRWLATDVGDDPFVVEMVKQSKECARDLERDLKKVREDA